jgi:hypothetical protein
MFACPPKAAAVETDAAEARFAQRHERALLDPGWSRKKALNPLDWLFFIADAEKLLPTSDGRCHPGERGSSKALPRF